MTTDDYLAYEAAKWARVDEARLQRGTQGLWIPRFGGVILLDEDLSTIQRRCVLAHELSHARHRDEGCRVDRWAERRADMEAARMLIDTVQYAAAEQVWGQNVHAIALELGVMPWVVAAYRDWLHDCGTLIIQ